MRKLENRFKFNDGTERNTDLELNWDETYFRSYDAQIGRFQQIDPLADFFDNNSPYTYVENNPIIYNDPFGLSKEDPRKRLPDVTVVGIRHRSKKKSSTAPQHLPQTAKPLQLLPNSKSQSSNNNLTTEIFPDLTKFEINNLIIQDVQEISFSNIAEELINSGKISFSKIHPAPPNPRFRDDLANANDNIQDAARGQQVHTSVYGHARGAFVTLDPRLLSLLKILSQHYTLGISELAGARHSANSRHYAGIAVDITSINGRAVGLNNPYYRQLMRMAKELGAAEVLGPGQSNHGGHIHLAMSRRN
jgi:RHS repeat-associated protein